MASKMPHLRLWLLLFLFINNTEAINVKYLERLYIMNGKYHTGFELLGNSHSTGEIQPQLSSPEAVIFISSEPTNYPHLYAGGVFVERTLVNLVESNARTTVRNLAQKLQQDLIASPRVISITGLTQMGKTATLARINYELNMLMPTVWTVPVDLSRVFPPQTSLLNDITLDVIIRHQVDEHVRDIFNQLLHYNPKKIVFLFDNINGMTNERLERIAAIITELVVERKVTIIVAGDVSTMNFLRTLKLPADYWKLEGFNFHQCKNFLRNIWKAQINLKLQKTQLNSRLTTAVIDERLNDYVSIVTLLFKQISLPVYPSTLMILSEKFATTTFLMFQQLQQNPIVGCLDYVLDSQLSPSQSLVVMKNNVLLNKKKLFDSIIAAVTRYHAHLFDATLIYGSVALFKITARSEFDLVAQELLRPITDLAKHSLEFLRINTAQAHFIIPITATDFAFIHPNFENYFAAEFLMRLMKLPVVETTPVNLIRRIFTDSDYKYLMEFINSQAELLEPMFIRDVLLYGKNLNTKMLDNLIMNGFENIYLQLHAELKEPHLLNELRQYFQDPTLMEYSSERTFGLLQRTADIVPGVPSTSQLRSRVDYLIDNNMQQTFKALKTLNIKFDNHLDYSKLLRSIVTKPVPNVNLFEFFIRYILPSHYSIALDELLYIAISEAGEAAIPIAKHLISLGANPSVIHNRGTLLHAAVKWNNVELLRFVMNDLAIKNINTLDNHGRTVFEVALDANPSPLNTPSGFWESMLYLIKNDVGLQIHYRTTLDEFVNLAIPNDDLQSAGLKIMLGGSVYLDSQIEHHLQLCRLKIHNNIWTDYDRIDFISTLAHHTPPALLYLLPKTQSLRRKMLVYEISSLSSDLRLLELLLKYRGVGQLHDNDRQHYRAVIKMLINHQRASLSQAVTNNIIDWLIDNIGDAKDLEDLEYFLQNGLFKNFNNDLFNALKLKLFQRVMVKPPIQQTSSSHITVYKRMLQTRLNYNRAILGTADVNEVFMRIVATINQRITGCLSRRTKRYTISSNCYITWTDVDEFNDGIDNNRRAINEVRVNSDKLLQQLAANELTNNKKAQQMIEFVQILQSQSTISITGNSKMLLNNVLQYGGIINYRQHQRLTNTINNVWQQQSSKFRLPSLPKFSVSSRSVAIFAAASLPIIRGIYGTVIMCMQENSNGSNCAYATSILALSAGLPTIGYFTMKYTPWMVDRFSHTALDMLPSSKASGILRENLKIMRNIGMKYGVHTVAAGLAAVGIGFDLYNIVEMSRMIDACNRQENHCLSKYKIDQIISLTFSCVTIPLTAGMIIAGAGLLTNVLVGLAMMAIEIIAIGINEIVYYRDKYHTNLDENFRIFFHKIAFQPTPQDVQALARRTDWINAAQQRMNDLLDSNDNIVAYAVGLGASKDTNLIPSTSIINMKDCSANNTKGLSRVLPVANENTILLCLPKHDEREIYDKSENTIPNAIYNCVNSFVVAHKQRWTTRNHGDLSIIYDLEYVDSGTIHGSDDYNNVFFIFNSTKDLKIIGTGNDTTNSYIIRTDSFNGQIVLNGNLMENTLDMSMISQSASLAYIWNNRLRQASVHLLSNITGNNNFTLSMLNEEYGKLHIIGRAGSSDIFSCNSASDRSKMHMSIDGKGGESREEMDKIIDCTTSIVRPYTNIIGSEYSNATNTAYVWLEGTFAAAIYNEECATIKPLSSKFMVIFANRPVLLCTLSIKYSNENGTLFWDLSHTAESSLLLSIESYRSSLSANSSEQIVNCLFIDNYQGIMIHPVINPIDNTTDTVLIEQFNAFLTVNKSSDLSVIFEHYRNINIFYAEKYKIVTKIIDSSTNRTFMFGSMTSDRFYIDNNTVFLFGNDGNDVYVLSSDSPKIVRIDNEAPDEAMDTLVIPDTACKWLSAKKGSIDIDGEYDVTLECLNNNTTDNSVILRNYLLSTSQQHLQIIWHNSKYILLSPYLWTNEADKRVDVALLFSFDDEWQSTILTVTSNDSNLVLNTSANNPLVAYKTGLRDVTLAGKYLNRRTSSFVILKDFFADHFHNIVSIEWLDFKIFELNNNDVRNVDDIQKLLFDSKSENNLIKEYLVNVEEPAESIMIEHNNNTLKNGNDQLGVLIVIGANPGQFHAQWNGTSLLLVAKGKSNVKREIYVKNWCIKYRQRLHRMEFFSSLQQQPIVIHNVDQIQCLGANDAKFIEALYKKFLQAQQQYLIDSNRDDNDQSRLIKCVGSIITEILANNKSMYKVFGFTSTLEHVTFMRENCNALFTKEDLSTLSLDTIKDTWKNGINIVRSSDEAIQNERQLIALVSKRLDQLDHHCWHNVTTFLSNDDGMNLVQKLNHITFSLSKCISGLCYRRKFE